MNSFSISLSDDLKKRYNGLSDVILTDINNKIHIALIGNEKSVEILYHLKDFVDTAIQQIENL